MKQCEHSSEYFARVAASAGFYENWESRILQKKSSFTIIYDS